MTRPGQKKATQVTARSTQAEDTPSLRLWVEATVWSHRMLTALEQGAARQRPSAMADALVREHGYYSLVDARASTVSPQPG